MYFVLLLFCVQNLQKNSKLKNSQDLKQKKIVIYHVGFANYFLIKLFMMLAAVNFVVIALSTFCSLLINADAQTN